MGYGHNKKTKNQKSWQVKEPVVRTDKAPIERVDLDPAKFDRLIDQKGTEVLIYRTMYCSRVKSVDGAEHEIDCDLCNGSGFIDLDPICVTAFIQTQTLDKLPNIEGMVDGNSIQVTFPIGVEVQYFTLMEIKDYSDIVFHRVMRKPGTMTDVLKYSACRVNVLMDYNGVRYHQDKDFKIDLNGNLEWLATGNTPADNLPYSLHYEAATQFRAKAAVHVNRFSQVVTGGKSENLKFQEQWWFVKEFLPKREDRDGNELEQGPYDDHTIVDED